MSRIDEWNQRHRAAHDDSREPAPVVVEAADLAKAGRALDLASGRGRNANCLADRGWNVVTVDAAIAAMPRVLCDLERDPLPFFDESFDLVVNVFFLHRPLFAEIRRVLRPGGFFAAQIHIRGINPAFCVKPGELKDVFADWEIVKYREQETAELIARKRLTANR